MTNDAFTLDIHALDNQTYVLDGGPGTINDAKYRALIKVSLLRQNKTFTVENVSNILKSSFDIVSITYEEGYMQATINIVFATVEELLRFNAIMDINDGFIGKPNGINLVINRYSL